MSLRVTRVADIHPQPWSNRAGLTRELLAWPSSGDWRLRVSVATIEQDVPFSEYLGVQRWLVVLEGDGVELKFRRQVRSLKPSHSVFHFDGAQVPQCRVLGGIPALAFNVMHRGGGQATVLPAPTKVTWSMRSDVRALFTRDPVDLQVGEGEPLKLPPMSLVWSDDAADQPWTLKTPGRPYAWWVAFSRSRGG
jgi:environmental stress-induced protein Ves